MARIRLAAEGADVTQQQNKNRPSDISLYAHSCYAITLRYRLSRAPEELTRLTRLQNTTTAAAHTFSTGVGHLFIFG